MLKFLVKSLFFIVLMTLVSCSPKHSEIVVADYGDYKISMDEFEKAYSKNVGSSEKAQNDSIQNYRDFLDLYVNFKMKLRNAKVRALNDDERIKTELDEYENSIGKSYLLEKELIEKGIHDLYEKRKEELRVSHLLIRTDTISVEKAEIKAHDIIDRIKNGGSFEVEVSKYSDDQFSKNSGGDIYYFTAGMILPEFEEIAYDTPVGEVSSEPLKTRYGVHIIKVTDRIARIPQIRASHILVRNDTPTDKDGKSKKELIAEILLKARAGEDFGELAAKYSEDPGSKENKGDLGFFGRRQMVQPFDEAAFNLEIGEISDIVETQFGYHIIKVTDKKNYPSFESDKKSLRDIYDKTRKDRDYKNFITNTAKEFNLKMHDEVSKDVISALGDGELKSDYDASEFKLNHGKSVLFTIGNEAFTLDSLVSFHRNDAQVPNKVIDKKNIAQIIDKFKDDKLLEARIKKLATEDETFADLMNEYKNGILIFRLQEDEVWSKMKLDSLEIHKFYEKNNKNYIWPDRVKFLKLTSKNDSLIYDYYGQLKNGINFDTLLVAAKQASSAMDGNDFVEVESSPLANAAYQLNSEGDYSNPINEKNNWAIVKLVKKDPSRIKTFEEARAEVTSAFQDEESSRLEKAYIAYLKKIYEPNLYYDELDKAYKN